MRFGRRKVSKEISILEASVHLKGWKGHSHPEFLVQPPDLSSISFPSSPEGVCEIGKDSKTIFMGWKRS